MHNLSRFTFSVCDGELVERSPRFGSALLKSMLVARQNGSVYTSSFKLLGIGAINSTAWLIESIMNAWIFIILSALCQRCCLCFVYYAADNVCIALHDDAQLAARHVGCIHHHHEIIRFCAQWNSQYYCIDYVLRLDAIAWGIEQLLDTHTDINATVVVLVIVKCYCDFGIACSCYCLFCSCWWCWCWGSIIHNQQKHSRDRYSRLAILAMLDLQT